MRLSLDKKQMSNFKLNFEQLCKDLESEKNMPPQKISPLAINKGKMNMF